MGLFSKSKSSDTSASTPSEPKKGLYERFIDAKLGRNNKMSDEDILKYTGKTRAEFDKYAATAPGVGVRQVSGTVMGQGSGGVTAPTGWGYKPKNFDDDKGKKEGKVVKDDDSYVA